VALADGDVWIKGLLYDQDKLAILNLPAVSVVLKNFTKRNDTLVINDTTTVYKTGNVEVDPPTLRAASNTVFPSPCKNEFGVLHCSPLVLH
jgi:hypothetical protein